MSTSAASRASVPMQVSFGDGRTEDIREGARITLRGRDSNSPSALFHLAVASSWNLKGRPVLVNGFLPGVSMSVEAPSPKLSGGQAEALLGRMWQEVWPHFSRWSLLDPQSAPVMDGHDEKTHIRFAWDDLYRWLPGAVQFDVVEDFSASDAAPRSPRSWNARYAPQQTSWEAPRERAFSRGALDGAIEEALHLTLIADDAKFKSLPVPVRYRATGAIAAWEAAYRLAGREGGRVSAMLSDAYIDPRATGKHIAAFVEDHCTVRLDSHTGATLLRHAANSVLSQAFWSREGALYEPTQALHQLIEQSDIATDLPVGSVSLPSPALCILPVPAMRTQADGFDALFVLEHGMTGDVSRRERWLTFGLCRNHASVEAALIDYLCVDASDAMIPLAKLIERVPGISESRVRTWKRVIDYAVKLMLYRSLENAAIRYDRSYSTAPRTFSGLGKRKRDLRLAEIAKLYDRYLIGPAVLPETLKDRGAGEHTGHEIRAHWRRGHFRMQPFGLASTQRKLIFVMPTLVRADRL